MSLKAKLEAVIYAAEEPVTLAQLAGLFADEAVAWKAGQEAIAAASAAGTEEEPRTGDAAEPLNKAFPYLDLETVEGDATAQADGTSEQAPWQASAPEAQGDSAEPAPDLNSEAISEETGEDEPSAAAATEEAATSEEAAEAEARRAAKQRERDARETIGQLLGELITEYAADERGIEIREIAGGYRMATKPQCHDAVRSFVKSLKPPLKLSLPALETLAVIAYKQPVTVPEVNEIRGVDSSGVFGSLLGRKLITTAGRKAVVGRPILYKTTREFLLRFGLKDVSELPSMEEFEKMAASELEETETEAMPGEEAAPAAEDFNADLSSEQEEHDQDSAVSAAEENPAAPENVAGAE